MFDFGTYIKSAAWPFEEARRLTAHLEAKRARAGYKDKGYVLFETGYGPSGLPHIGTFGEVFRTAVVRFAFEQMHPGVKTRLFAFSDDMDALRKVPENLPNKDMLIAHIGQPLSRIPDPFGTHESFAGHNNAMLRAFLDKFGFDYEFFSSTEQYQGGKFNAALLQTLKCHQAIRDIIVPTLGAERAATYSPFLPITEAGQVLQVPVVRVDEAAGTITYQYKEQEFTTPVTDGHCKLQWKADWAMRWYALDVDYEMSGKDLIDSVQLGSKICTTLGGLPPVNLTYEHFVDEHGAKISKSKGNGLTIDQWLDCAPPETLSLYMYRTPTRQKKLYRTLIPTVVDEYFGLLNDFPGQAPAEKLENPVWHIHQGEPPASPFPAGSGLTYAMLLNLVSATAASESSVVWRYLQRYVPDLTPEKAPVVEALINGAIRYYNETIKPTQLYHVPQAGLEQDALAAVKTMLAGLGGEEDAEAIQTAFYELGKQFYGKEKLRDWFAFLYKSLLGFSQGPRLGSFVKVYGVAEMVVLVEKAQNRD